MFPTQGCEEVSPLNTWNEHQAKCNGESKRKTALVSKEIRAILAKSKDGVVKLPTGGQVSVFHCMK